MNIDRKEIKKKAKGTIKSHYLIYVLTLLLCAILGVAYTESTSAFTVLKGGNDESYNEMAQSVSENAYINENGEVVINNSVVDSVNNIAEWIFNYYIESSTEAQIIRNAAMGGNVAPDPDEKYGIITVSYQNGVLASLINNVKSGSFLLKISNSLSHVINSPSATTIITLIVGVLILLAYTIFIQDALWITTKRMFLESQTYTSSNPRVFFFLFKRKTFFRACTAFFVKQLYQMLWSITIIGGIIKYFSYAMVPYIVAENPTLNPHQAITLSRRMMKGHKWELCKLYLTFTGWFVLNVITFGLVGLIYFNPYFESTIAQYYLKLRKITIDEKTEGYEYLNDKYIDAPPTEEDLEPVYGQMIKECKSRTGEVEKFTGVAGFFANVFGIVLHYNDKAKRIGKQEEDAMLIKTYSMILEGKLYPASLHPTSSSKARTPLYQTLRYLKRYSILNIVALFFIGFYPATVIFMVCVLLKLKIKPLTVCITTAAILALVFVTFNLVLKVSLIRGLLFDALL